MLDSLIVLYKTLQFSLSSCLAATITLFTSQRTLTMFVKVVALRYCGVNNELPQLPQA